MQKTNQAGRFAARRGFSLLELMLVLIIIGLLSAVAAVAVVQQAGKARISTTKASLDTIQSAINNYQLDNGALPPDIRLLWTNKYLEAGRGEVDAWGEPFYYRLKEPGVQPPYELMSYGPDREPGTDDDISVWTMKNEQQAG